MSTFVNFSLTPPSPLRAGVICERSLVVIIPILSIILLFYLLSNLNPKFRFLDPSTSLHTHHHHQVPDLEQTLATMPLQTSLSSDNFKKFKPLLCPPYYYRIMRLFQEYNGFISQYSSLGFFFCIQRSLVVDYTSRSATFED